MKLNARLALPEMSDSGAPKSYNRLAMRLDGGSKAAVSSEVHLRNSQDHFAAIEGLGITTRRYALHSSQAH